MPEERYKQLHSRKEVMEEIDRLLEVTQDSDGFMVAFWNYKDNNINYQGKVTHSFPQRDFILTISQFAADCCTELQQAAATPPPPLPTAQIVKAMEQEDGGGDN